MLENVSKIMYTAKAAVAINEVATHANEATSKARNNIKKLTSKTISQFATKASAILALPPIPPASELTPEHTSSFIPTPIPQLRQLALRTSLACLIPNETTLVTELKLPSSTSLSSLQILPPALTTETSLKLKEILVNLAATIVTTNFKHSQYNSNNYTNYNSNAVNCNINSHESKNVSRHVMILENDRKEFYHHMPSLNHQNCTNLLKYKQQTQQQQQQEQQKRNRSQQPSICNSKQFFLLLLTCFVAFITIFSLPQTVAALKVGEATVSEIAAATFYMPTTNQIASPYTLTNTVTFLTKTNETYKQLQRQQQKQRLLFSTAYSVLQSSSSDNINKDNDNKNSRRRSSRSSRSRSSNSNKFVDTPDTRDNVDDLTILTSSSPSQAIAIENSHTKDSKNSSNTKKYYPFENHIISRLIRSLDVSGSGTGLGSSFSPSPSGGGGVGPSSGLTNIFNQNLDTGLSNNIECPSFDESSACPCYKFEDGLFLECPGTTATSLRSTLEHISSPIHSLSIYDFDRSVTSLSQDVFQPGVNIRHLQFSHSHLETLKENSLKNVRASLESLSIVNGKLTQAVQKPCRRQCSSRIPSQIVCAQDKDGRNCRKLKECRLREINCRLRCRKQPMLMQTYMERCRFIKDKTGQNKCAPPLRQLSIKKEDDIELKTWMHNCKRLSLRCSSFDNGKRACYRCPRRGDICQLLTACQAERVNCGRLNKTRLMRVHDNECEYLVPGKLPSSALNSMHKLSALDFDYNEIANIKDYSFYGLRLSKLNMKGNRLQGIPEHAFVGLEESIQEIDFSENSLRTFPLLALRKLDYLRILRLSNNKISTFYGDIQLATNNASAAAALRLPSLTFLDLSSNQFTEIGDDCFRTFPQLKTLSMYANQIEVVKPEAFKSLKELMSLDMSHNRIIIMDAKIFDKNKRLQTVDLSHNHIHSIYGVFSNLPHLREIFLSENNILELPADAFTNSSNVEVIYLESNAIAHVDPNVFSTLSNLDHLYLRANFIPLLPVTLLDKCHKLSSLSLDNNEIQDLEIGMFRKLEFLREVRLHNNRIRRIRKGVFEPLPALQELHVQKNNIEDIEPGAFQTLSNLQHINLQDNQLTVLEDIFPKAKENSSLLTIQLEANYLNKIHTKTFKHQDKIQIMWLNYNELTRIEKSMFEDQQDLARLYLNHNFIRDIDRETFAKLKNLKFLDMSYNRMKQLRRDYFSSLENLEELSLSQNYIEAIEGYAFNKLKNLKILDLSNNPLHQITNDVFMEDLLLTHLNLKNTSLRKIEMNTFKSLQNLNDLNLEGNLLSPVDIQKLEIPGLRTLYLSHNNFSHVGGKIISNMFDKLRSLQHLTMANCSLSSLPEDMFIKNTNLVKLDLCDNILNSMDRNLFYGLNVFKELRVCRNSLNEFPHIALYNLSTLEILDLSRNQFSTIDFYKLSGTINLRHLNLKDNKITSLTGFNAVNLTQLDTVDLSGNLLLSLPANFLRHSINLQKVDLSSNRFLQIPSSALSDISIPRLSWLNLTGNPINKIYTVKEERYPYLKELYICQTNLSILTSKDFEAFQALQHLHLINNRITRISPGAFKGLTNLLTLDISVNELELLPKERLLGLKLLRVLNISNNVLKDLEEFSPDLAQLQVFDLSFNQLDRISRKTFRNLHSLVELYLMGNRMTVLSNDAFRYLRKLHVLDLRKNYFELIPIEALQPLETNIKTLRLEENPLHCSCDAQKLWEWLRDHRKWSSSIASLTTSAASPSIITSSLMSSSMLSSSSSGGVSSSSVIMSLHDNINYLRCEHPAELRGKIFAKMEPQQFCDAPLIPKIAIQDIQPYSVIVSWQSREHLGLNGYEIIYHAISDTGSGGGGSGSNVNSVMSGGGGGSLADIDEIRGKRLNGSANSAKLTKLSPNTRYHICVIGTGNWLSEPVAIALQRIHFNDTFLMPRDEPSASSSSSSSAVYDNMPASSSTPYHLSYTGSFYNTNGIMTFGEHSSLAQPQQQQALIENTIVTENALQEVLKNSRFSTCTDVQTLDSTPSVITDENGLATNGFIHSILTRRLGLIVGCCLGIIVFIVMISVLSYVKLKKQRIENAKRQANMPPDYMSYRHFSIPNEELLRMGVTTSSTIMSSVPSGISAHISGTSLSTSATTTATATTPIGILKITENSGGCGTAGANSNVSSGATAAVATATAASTNTTSIGGNGTLNLTTSTTIATSSLAAGSAISAASTTNEVVATTGLTNNHNNHHHHHQQHQHHHVQQPHHNHHMHHHQQQQQQQQQQHQHYQGNGNVVGGGSGGGYMAAGVVLGANHLNNVAC